MNEHLISTMRHIIMERTNIFNLLKGVLKRIFKIILDPFIERKAVGDIADYLGISRSEVLKRARIKDTPEEDVLWKSYERRTNLCRLSCP